MKHLENAVMNGTMGWDEDQSISITWVLGLVRL